MSPYRFKKNKNREIKVDSKDIEARKEFAGFMAADSLKEFIKAVDKRNMTSPPNGLLEMMGESIARAALKIVNEVSGPAEIPQEMYDEHDCKKCSRTEECALILLMYPNRVDG